jgi:hypothetical protein
VLWTGVLCSQTSTIKGNIKNSNDEAIEFATIQLLFDSIYHQSALSDSLGNYYLKATKEGECKLMINILGYSPSEKIILLRKDTIINFVLQPDSINLKEVIIIGKKDFIQSKSDRLIINIRDNIETEGKETIDILRQLPTINISEQSLNIFGKSSVIVYINDRIIRLDGQSLLNYLNSFPPDIISSIEIITTPPAQFDSEGNVGIINIITKKNILPGWKGYFRAGYIQNSYSSYMISAFTNYSGKKFFFEGNFTNANFSYLNQSDYYSLFPAETITTSNPKRWNSVALETQISLGYTFNEKSNVIVDFKIPLFNKDIISDIQNITRFLNPANNQIDSTIYSHGETIKNYYTFNSEIFFKQILSKNSYFTTNIAYLNNYTRNNRDFSSLSQIGNANLTTNNFYTKGSINYHILTPKLDFTFPLCAITTYTGFKLSLTDISSDNEFINRNNDYDFLDSLQSNKYEYEENVLAVYFSMEKNIRKLEFNAGIRSEMTKTDSYSLPTEMQNKDSYIDFFPSIYLSYKFNEKNVISFSYADRIERPPYQYLDPFKWYISQYDYATGNPFLSPSYIRGMELTYLSNTKFNAKIYYTYQKNKIGQYVVLDSLNMMNQIQKADNFLNVNDYGINMYSLYKLGNWLETIMQIDFSYSKYLSNNEAFSDISGINGTIIMNNTFVIKNKFQIICNLEERIPGLYSYRQMNNFFKLDIGINYIYSKKNLEIRLLFNDIFKTANPEYSYISGKIKQIYKNYYDTRMLRLTLVWKLGNWYIKESQKSPSSNIEEKQRL